MPTNTGPYRPCFLAWQRTRRFTQIKAIHNKPKSCRWSSSTSTPSSTSSSQPASENGQVIFSGIQPTGVPHLGNYLGAVREWVRLQNASAPGTRLLFSIVDLHALTIPQNACRLKNSRREMFATLLAAGLDPKKSAIFYQSAVCDAVLKYGSLVFITILTVAGSCAY